MKKLVGLNMIKLIAMNRRIRVSKYFLIVTIAACLFHYEAVGQTDFNLMPYPSKVKIGTGEFLIDKGFTVGFAGGTNKIFDYSTRFLRRLDGRTGLFFNQNYLGENDTNETAALFIRIHRNGELELNEDESYELTISSEQIDLVAETDFGAMRGLETLLQLLEPNENGYYFPSVTIKDEPRFPWRGLMIDVCRHWLPIDVIKRNIDGMAAVKMNVLHLHLTEDQGFRIESKVFPKLHELGSNGDYFTQVEIREIISYAGDRGIRVIPEFDIPGHATSWFVGYPELASAPGPYEIETEYGVKDPTMDPTKETTYQFLDKFIGEMANLFPDEYMHIGGDENNGKQWDANPQIQEYMSKNNITSNQELQGYFNERLLVILNKYGKHMMGWDEIFQPGIPKDIVIHSWRGRTAMEQSAERGYQTILSNGYYIDLVQPASFHYLNDPVPEDTPLSQNEIRNILGGEAAMWSEIVTAETVDSRIWPRTAAIAERLWSPRDINDVDDMYRRLSIISVQLEELNLLHLKNYEMQLRRLSGGKDISTLKTLTDVLEPLQGYARHGKIKFTTSSPFTRLADVANPDATVAREFRNIVDDYLETGDLEKTQEIKDYLLLWIENHDDFKDLVAVSPILKNAEKLSLDLSNISKIALQALSSSVKHTEAWKSAARKTIDAARKPHLECELKVVDPIQKLVDASK